MESPKKIDALSPSKSDVASSSKGSPVYKRPLKRTKKTERQTSTHLPEQVELRFPDEPQESESKKYFKILKEFAQDPNQSEYDFPTDLTNTQRKIVHSLAEEFGLEHFSRGSKVRYITVQKKASLKHEEWQLFGYIGLFGPAVNASGNDHNKTVPEDYIQRVKRDGPVNHITLLIREEVVRLTKSAQDLKSWFDGVVNSEKLKSDDSKELLLNIIEETIVDDWADLGLGCVRHGKNEAYFKVIEWPSAAKFRQRVNLPPKDFHITVGFSMFDIHDVPKVKSTLLSNQNLQQQLEKLTL